MPRDTIKSLKARLRRAAVAQRELQKRVFHLKSLYDLGREIGVLIDTKDIMRNLLMVVIGTFGSLRGVILLIDLDRHAIEAEAHRGMGSDSLALLLRAVESGQFGHIRGISRIQPSGNRSKPRRHSRQAPFGPLAGEIHIWSLFEIDEHLLGVIGLGPKLSGDTYTSDDQELLTTLSNQGAVALKNAIAHQDVVRYAAELEASLRRIQILESIKSNLAKFVPKTVQDLIEQSPDAPLLEKHEADVSVLFADMTGYTRFSAQMELDRLNRLVERYFGAFLDEILAQGGDVNETAGDGLMVIFREPDPSRHARSAVLAALGIQRRTHDINRQFEGQIEPITMKVGVNSGIAAVGATKIEGLAGTRWTYTASGPTTNIAARLAGLAEGATVVLSEETRRRLGDDFILEELGFQSLKNVPQPVRAYRVTAAAHAVEVAPAPVELRRHPRRSVSWPVRLWVGGKAHRGEARDVSAHGLRVAVPVSLLEVGRAYRIDIVAGDGREVVRTGAVRYLGERGAGIETEETLPLE